MGEEAGSVRTAYAPEQYVCQRGRQTRRRPGSGSKSCRFGDDISRLDYADLPTSGTISTDRYINVNYIIVFHIFITSVLLFYVFLYLVYVTFDLFSYGVSLAQTLSVPSSAQHHGEGGAGYYL